MTHAVGRLAGGLRAAGLGSALDVFTPALAPSVGQDLRALADLGEWSKSMTYLDALGPASMPFELRGYADWLTAAGEADARVFMADLIGFDAPGLGVAGPQREALDGGDVLASARWSGRRAPIVGIDAVEMPGVCEVADEDLMARIDAVRDRGLGLSPCWELLFMGSARLERIAAAWVGDEGP